MRADKKLSRKQKLQAQNRQYILESALDLFLMNGFSDTTMHDIAERSEFAVGTLYRFFESKEQIYESLMNDAYTRVIRHTIEKLHQNNDKAAYELLRIFIVTILTEMRQNSRLIKLYLNNAVTPGRHAGCSRQNCEFTEMDNEISRLHRDIIIRCMDEGIFISQNPFVLEIGISALIDSYMKCIAHEDMEYTPEEWFKIIIKPFLKGLSPA